MELILAHKNLEQVVVVKKDFYILQSKEWYINSSWLIKQDLGSTVQIRNGFSAKMHLFWLYLFSFHENLSETRCRIYVLALY